MFNLKQDPRSAYFRALHPDDNQWFDDQNIWFAKASSILTDIRFLLAARMFDDIPEDFLPLRFGPPEPEDVPEPVVVPDKFDVMRDLAG